MNNQTRPPVVAVTPEVMIRVTISGNVTYLDIDAATQLEQGLRAALSGLGATEKSQRDPQDVLDDLKKKAADALQSVEDADVPPDA